MFTHTKRLNPSYCYQGVKTKLYILLWEQKTIETQNCARMLMQSKVSMHVETVCLLSKLHEAKHQVNVTLGMDEMDLTAAKSKATYEEIKKYVAEHNNGMKDFKMI